MKVLDEEQRRRKKAKARAKFDKHRHLRKSDPCPPLEFDEDETTDILDLALTEMADTYANGEERVTKAKVAVERESEELEEEARSFRKSLNGDGAPDS